uniref:E3 ubiquitin-protein ligase SopA n=1 Tax=Arsenophonus endosymbiont of Trialeurodes vaporariorum TaxID=235567 RepID=A0A3B0M2M1_9GAMM
MDKKEVYVSQKSETQSYIELKKKILADFPALKAMAKNFMQEHIKNTTGQDIDPDKVRLYSFATSTASSETYTGFEYWDPTNSITLTELAFKNFSAPDQERLTDTLNANYAVYTESSQEPVLKPDGLNFGEKYFGVKNEVRILASDLRKILNENDFYTQVKNSLDTFWNTHEADMLILAKAQFIAKAREAKWAELLSEKDYNFVMKTAVPNLPLADPITMSQLKENSVVQGHVYALDINGYVSTDILRFLKSGSGEILYIPSSPPFFKVFSSDTAMRQWIAEQGNDSEKKAKLESHFSLVNRQDGFFHTGVDNALKKLASGAWDVTGSGIDKHGDDFCDGNIFSAVIAQTKERNFSDIDIIIKSNAEVTWERWLGYIKITNQIFGPIVGLIGGPVGAVLATGTFVAQIGVEIHQAVTGDTEEERRQRLWDAATDVGITLLFGGFGSVLSDEAIDSIINTDTGLPFNTSDTISPFKVDTRDNTTLLEHTKLEPISIGEEKTLELKITGLGEMENMTGRGAPTTSRNDNTEQFHSEPSISRKQPAPADEQTYLMPKKKLKLGKLKKSLNLHLPSLHLSSDSVLDTDMQSLLESSKVRWLQNNKHLSVYGNDNLYRRFETALNKIESTNTGSSLLKSIDEISREKSMNLAIYLDCEDLGVVPHNYTDAHNSRGTSSDFYCNLNKVEHTSEQKINQENFDACKVFHELIHVLNNLKGERIFNKLNGEYIDIVPIFYESKAELPMDFPPLFEEARTVGLGRYSKEELSENKFRDEIGVPQRISYAHESYIINNDNTVTQGLEEKKLYLNTSDTISPFKVDTRDNTTLLEHTKLGPISIGEEKTLELKITGLGEMENMTGRGAPTTPRNDNTEQFNPEPSTSQQGKLTSSELNELSTGRQALIDAIKKLKKSIWDAPYEKRQEAVNNFLRYYHPKFLLEDDSTSLSGCFLSNIDLRNAKLPKFNFSRADLSGAKMNDTTLTNVDLTHANLFRTDFTKANLHDADLSHARAIDTDFTGASLIEATLNDANLNGANFIRANLSGAKMNQVSINKANFSGVTFDEDTVITLALPNEWNIDTLDEYINHINNYDSGSLLTAVDSIDVQYSEIKINLIQQLINSLQIANVDTSSVAEALIDILSLEPYISDENIWSFMRDIYINYLTKYNTEVFVNSRKSVLNALLNVFDEQISLAFCEFNAAFIQTIRLTMEIPEIKESAVDLYRKYINTDTIQKILNSPDVKLNFGDYSGNPDWSDIDANNYILLSPVDNEKVMILSSSVLTKMLRPKIDTEWNHFYLYQNGKTVTGAEGNLTDMLIAFPLFSTPYSYALRSIRRFESLLNALNLQAPLRERFLSALKRATTNSPEEKMIAYEDEQVLKSIFNQKLNLEDNLNPSLTPEHYDEILSAYRLNDADEKEKAESLLSLSIVFTRYSSSYVFGTEADFPLPLRDYSGALMKKAHELSPEIFIENNQDQFSNWHDRLFGKNGAFSCTAVLSGIMIEHAKAIFPNIIKTIVPPAWQ